MQLGMRYIHPLDYLGPPWRKVQIASADIDETTESESANSAERKDSYARSQWYYT